MIARERSVMMIKHSEGNDVLQCTHKALLIFFFFDKEKIEVGSSSGTYTVVPNSCRVADLGMLSTAVVVKGIIANTKFF